MSRFLPWLAIGVFFALGDFATAGPIYCFDAALEERIAAQEAGTIPTADVFRELAGESMEAPRECDEGRSLSGIEALLESRSQKLNDLLSERSRLGPIVSALAPPGGRGRNRIR